MEESSRTLTRVLQLKKKKSKYLGEDFNYVVKRVEKSKICFGSGMERTTMVASTKGLVSKHARSNISENLVNIAPGMYGVQPMTLAMYSVSSRPYSKLGTVMGGRTTPIGQVVVTTNMLTPAPCTYNYPTTFPEDWSDLQNTVPFNVRVMRKPVKMTNTPGVGYYNVAPYKHRTIPMYHSFGGRKTIVAAVEMKCGPFNLDICEVCKLKPVGDYWKLYPVGLPKPQKKPTDPRAAVPEGIFLCRKCYEIERKHHPNYDRVNIGYFKKFRDCTQFHFHDGCEAKLFLWSLEDMRRLKVKEGYLALYFFGYSANDDVYCSK